MNVQIWMLVGAASIGLLLAARSEAQSFTVVHSFGKTLSYTNSATPINADGAWPGDLIVDGNTLYGTTTSGGNTGLGTIFKMNLDGTGFTTLHVFSHDEGWNPNARLLLWSNTLYGSTVNGGSATYGTIFAVNNDGTGYRELYHFTGGADGGYPQLLRNVLQQVRPGVNTHVVKADVILADLHPGDGDGGFVFWMQATLQTVTSRAILAHDQVAGVARENGPQLHKKFCERLSHRV